MELLCVAAHDAPLCQHVLQKKCFGCAVTDVYQDPSVGSWTKHGKPVLVLKMHQHCKATPDAVGASVEQSLEWKQLVY
jgi:hypothetical protein